MTVAAAAAQFKKLTIDSTVPASWPRCSSDTGRVGSLLSRLRRGVAGQVGGEMSLREWDTFVEVAATPGSGWFQSCAPPLEENSAAAG
jgi:hypothetical protein